MGALRPRAALLDGRFAGCAPRPGALGSYLSWGVTRLAGEAGLSGLSGLSGESSASMRTSKGLSSVAGTGTSQPSFFAFRTRYSMSSSSADSSAKLRLSPRDFVR